MCFFNGVPVYLCVSVCVASVRRSERISDHTRSLDKHKVARVPGLHWNNQESFLLEFLQDLKIVGVLSCNEKSSPEFYWDGWGTFLL